MENTDSSKAEVERLNVIISSLVEQVTSLKSENALLKKNAAPAAFAEKYVEAINASKKDLEEVLDLFSSLKNNGSVISGSGSNVLKYIYSIEHSCNMAQNKIYSIHDYWNGINIRFNTLKEIITGLKHKISSNNNFMNDINNSFDTIIKIINGINNIFDSIDNFMNRINNEITTVSVEKNTINSQTIYTPDFSLPAIAVDEKAILKLFLALKGNLAVRAKDAKAKNLARQLLLLHNNGSASGHELRTSSGLSKQGWAKHFPKVRRAGFYVKAGPRKYVLTVKSKEILYKVFESQFRK